MFSFLSDVKYKTGLKLSPTVGRKHFQFRKISNIKDAPNTDFTARRSFVFHQQFSDCVFNACGLCAVDVDFVKNGIPPYIPARLAPYREYRSRHNDINEDTGANGYECCQVYQQIGLGPESLDPYLPERFTAEPFPEYLEAAKTNQLLDFKQLDVTDKGNVCDILRAALADHGTMLPFGASLPKAFMAQAVSNSGEFMSAWPWTWWSMAGGHEMALAGSIRPLAGESFEPYFLIVNSWGQWGKADKNGLRGVCKVSEKIMQRWILEANVLTTME